MQKIILLFFILFAGLNSINRECAIEVIKTHINYKALSGSKITEDEGIKNFQMLSNQRNKMQEEMIEKLILNFDILPPVRLNGLY
jgi:hypothetical protein